MPGRDRMFKNRRQNLGKEWISKPERIVKPTDLISCNWLRRFYTSGPRYGKMEKLVK
jgi:hypothetical protein